MYQVSVLAYDGVFASALTGVMDLLNLTGGKPATLVRD